MKVFRWKNCYADVAASEHGGTVQSFFDDGVAVRRVFTGKGDSFTLPAPIGEDPRDICV